MTPSKSLRPGTLGRAWLGTVATNGVLLIGGMTTGILAARLLGPEQRGVLGAVMFWPSLLAAMARVGVDEAIVHHWSRHPGRQGALLASAMAIVLAVGVSAWLLTVPLLPGLLGSERQAFVAFTTIFAAFWIPAVNMNAVLSAADRAAGRFGRANVLRVGPNLLYLAGIILLVVGDAISVAAFAVAALAGLLSILAVRLILGFREVAARPTRAPIELLARTGARFHAGVLAAQLSAHADRAILFLVFSDHVAGLYLAAWTFAASGLATVTSAVGFVLAPALAAERDRAGARALLAAGLRRTALLLYIGVGGALLVTPWLLPLLFGSAFADAVPMAMLLSIAVVPLTLRQTTVLCLRALGEARLGVTGELAALAGFLLAASILWAVGAGAEGLAAATIAGNACGLAAAARHLRRSHGIAPRAWLVPGPDMLRDGFQKVAILVRLARTV